MRELLDWYGKNKRDLPWRKNINAYNVWISEIMLQQTRVEQGVPFFNRFINRFPDIFELARATEQEVLKYWQGLGYYSRARNLHFTAKYVSNELLGKFPSNYSGLLKLKGIGEYTAAAIASISFKEVVPVLDGNAYRVYSRLGEIDIPINTPEAKKVFTDFARNYISTENPGDYNQAIMELGATVCLYPKPDCRKCPVARRCKAYKSENAHLFPVKSKKKAPTNLYLYYFDIRNSDEIALVKREGKGLWKNLYDIPFIESKIELNEKELVIAFNIKYNVNLKNLPAGNIRLRHQLTHFKVVAKYYSMYSESLLSDSFIKLPLSEFLKYPISRLTEKYIEKRSAG